MSLYAGEDNIWKCLKHPSKRRRSVGICPICLRDRLIALCPNCHDVRPCSCNLITSSSPFSLARSSDASSSSSSSSFLLRSTSLAQTLPVLRTKIPASDSCGGTPAKRKASLWWGFMKQNRGGKSEECDDQMIRRSQSLRNSGDEKLSGGKGRGWNFSGGMMIHHVFGRKTSKVVHEQRPRIL